MIQTVLWSPLGSDQSASSAFPAVQAENVAMTEKSQSSMRPPMTDKAWYKLIERVEVLEKSIYTRQDAAAAQALADKRYAEMSRRMAEKERRDEKRNADQDLRQDFDNRFMFVSSVVNTAISMAALLKPSTK
jgi:hypothetical protein